MNLYETRKIGIAAQSHGHTSFAMPLAESNRYALDVLACNISKMAARGGNLL
jgi:hypothetical protein